MKSVPPQDRPKLIGLSVAVAAVMGLVVMRTMNAMGGSGKPKVLPAENLTTPTVAAVDAARLAQQNKQGETVAEVGSATAPGTSIVEATPIKVDPAPDPFKQVLRRREDPPPTPVESDPLPRPKPRPPRPPITPVNETPMMPPSPIIDTPQGGSVAAIPAPPPESAPILKGILTSPQGTLVIMNIRGQDVIAMVGAKTRGGWLVEAIQGPMVRIRKGKRVEMIVMSDTGPIGGDSQASTPELLLEAEPPVAVAPEVPAREATIGDEPMPEAPPSSPTGDPIVAEAASAPR